MRRFCEDQVARSRLLLTGQTIVVLLLCASMGGSAEYTDLFDHSPNKVLPGNDDELISGITPEECAQKCLEGTPIVPEGECLSFDYWRSSSRCQLSKASSQSLGSDDRFDHYRMKDILSFFSAYADQALPQHDDVIVYPATVSPRTCALRCLLGEGSLSVGSCLSFDLDSNPERCLLSRDNQDTAGETLGSNTRFDHYQRNELCVPNPCVHGSCTNEANSYTCTCDMWWEGDTCDAFTGTIYPQNCADLSAIGIQTSGTYHVGHPQPFQVSCDMDTAGGGWTVIQRRQDGSVAFNNTWDVYVQGFGDVSGEFWLGLDKMHDLTTRTQNELYVYLEDWEGESRYARYSTFSVGDSDNNYQVTINGYSGDVDDELTPGTGRHNINGREFSTKDQDNDDSNYNCATRYGQGGWWYPLSCGRAMLNNWYLTGCSTPAPPSCPTGAGMGIVWYSWKGFAYSLKETTMMIRPDPTSAFNTCQNGGTLTPGSPGTGVYACTCSPGWESTYCEHDIDECASGPCGARGTCVDGVNSYSCSCVAGWTGVTCETDIDECASSPCGAHGTCTDGVNSYTCTCVTGYTGVNCDANIDECASSPCGAHGTCTDRVNSYTCNCEAGWTGDNCEADVNECFDNEGRGPCEQTCTNTDGSFTCSCGDGYVLNQDSLHCDDIDECESGPCRNHGTCVDGVNSYSCTCVTGWTGDTCQSDVNECSPNNGRGPCEQQCTNTDGSFTCSCSNGYVLNQDGLHCDVPTQITLPPQDSEKHAGEVATFICRATGHPRPNITWYHGGAISNSGGITITATTGGFDQHKYTESTLTITNLDRTDHGTYRCQATNRGGSQEVAVMLTVRERPDPPTVNSGLTSTATTVMCTWSLPDYLGNLPVTGSRVRYREIGEVEWNTNYTETAGINYEITGLDPFTLYEVQVAIGNDLGYSNDSPVAHVWTAEAAPGKVENLTVEGISATEVKVKWGPPDPNKPKGIILHYEVTYKRADETTESSPVTTDGNSTIYSINGLETGKSYTVRVWGVTSAGPGQETDITFLFEYIPSPPQTISAENTRPCSCVSGSQTDTSTVRVSWDPPAQPNGRILGYRLSYSMDGGTWTVDEAAGSPSEVTDLQPHKTYSIKVKAYNLLFQGEDSEVFPVVTSQGCPGPPENLLSDQIGDTCNISWSLPSVTNGDLNSYKVEVSATWLDTGSVTDIEAEPVTTSDVSDLTWTASLNDLPAYSTVHVTVRAKTCAEGERSEAATCTVHRIEPPATVPNVTTEGATLTSSTFTVLLPSISKRNGPIRCYQVIIVPMRKDETLDDLTARVGQPQDVLTSSAPPDGRTEPYIALAYSGSSYQEGRVTIGTGESCEDSCCREGEVQESPEPGNRKLSAGSKYTTVIRAYVDTSQERKRKRATSKIHTSSPFSTPVTTESSTPVGAIVGGILAVVAVLCIVGGGLFFYRRRLAGKDDSPLRIPRRLPSTKRTAKEDDTQLGAIGGMDEEAVEVKKSSAPKHKPKPHRPSRRGGASPSLGLRQPIPIQRLEREFARRHANDDQLFVEEYSSLPKPFGREYAEAYYNEENASRNKFRNIIAYDRGLVKLTPIDGVPGSGYIHASYMDGYQEQGKFIAAQGPMDNTIDDFWRMIWETGTTAIVMVTNLEENGKKKCSQYWPDSGEKTYAIDLVVRLEDTVTMVDHVTRTFLIRKAGERRVRKVTHFHFIGWPDFGLPKSPMGLLKFHKTVMSALTPRDRPIVVHCSAGVGRTGTFITIDAMLDMIRAEGKVDVFGFVEQMRQNRSFMVQTEGQYVFIFKAILEYYLYGDTETEVSNIHRYMQNLKKEDPQTGKTGLETEFGKLTRIPVDKANMRSGNLPENLSKNRVLQVLPYDTTRVFLQQKPGVKGADYINASFIDGYNMKDAYIATQGPLDRTVEDFWRMVWEWNSCSIVMITEIKEKGQSKCAMYWPEEGSLTFGDFTVTLQEKTDFPDYTLRTFHLNKGKGGRTRTVQQFHFHGWPEVGIPDNAAGMIDLIGQVQKQQQHSGNGPITVHCSAGAGRTGAFCAISTVLERVKAEGVCDVFQVVKTLRLQRPHMVQTLDQYQFCYQAVVEYLDSFDHYANFR